MSGHVFHPASDSLLHTAQKYQSFLHSNDNIKQIACAITERMIDNARRGLMKCFDGVEVREEMNCPRTLLDVEKKG